MRYIGIVSTFRPNEHFGFIKLDTITPEVGGPAGNLLTTQDIYVHNDDCSSPLRQGMQIIFEVTKDTRRGGDSLRAMKVARHHMQELVVIGDEADGSRALISPTDFYVAPTLAQRLMKPVDPYVVGQVSNNRPMSMVPRTFDESSLDATEITRRLMKRIFPQFAAINEDGVDMADEQFDDVIRQAAEDHKGLGMHDQAQHVLSLAGTYKGLRTVLRSEEDLLRPDTLIPIQYLPDLFMAVPVWYFWADQKIQTEAETLQRENDPRVHEKLRYFCDLVPNQRWINMFLMYNRRMRTLRDYQGDLIPPRIIARIRKLAPLFDHLVIMTPYHDVAGKDWQDLQWIRSIDPYVVGFLKGVPFMFVLGRFSDSGTFPLYSELVADTVAFLRANVQKLQGFNAVGAPYWYSPGGPDSVSALGNQLMVNARELLAAFDAGNLFDWLRGEDV